MRISELIDDCAYLESSDAHGWVGDVIAAGQGALRSVMVQPDVGHAGIGSYDGSEGGCYASLVRANRPLNHWHTCRAREALGSRWGQVR